MATLFFKLITIVFLLSSCAALHTARDAGTVGLVTGAAAVLTGPVGAATAGAVSYLIVDNVGKEELIKEIKQDTLKSVPFSSFWSRYKLWIILSLLIALAINVKKTVLYPVKVLMNTKTP